MYYWYVQRLCVVGSHKQVDSHMALLERVIQFMAFRRKFNKNDSVMFHSFPLKNKEILKKGWK